MPETLAPPARVRETPAALVRRREPISVAEYHRMIDAGVFASDNRYELLEGRLVPKMTINPRHAVFLRKLDGVLSALLPAGWHVRSQNPITLSTSEPEPDLGVVRGDIDDYLHRHPGPADVALVIEVSDSTLADDRPKAAIYAAAGLPEYWILNLVDGVLERRRDPRGRRYAATDTLRPGETAAVQLGGDDAGSVVLAEVLPGS